MTKAQGMSSNASSLCLAHLNVSCHLKAPGYPRLADMKQALKEKTTFLRWQLEAR